MAHILSQLSPDQLASIDKQTLDYILKYKPEPEKNYEKEPEKPVKKEIDKSKPFSYVISDKGWIKLWFLKYNKLSLQNTQSFRFDYTINNIELIFHIENISQISIVNDKIVINFKQTNDNISNRTGEICYNSHEKETFREVYFDNIGVQKEFIDELQIKLMGF